ncbi:hypothetical protein CG471_23785 [Sphingobium sp. IP1]|jgi:hypothetical protein|uniref:hypothetical protein n=1 Tax=Sphingobium sp. IP1 TaxID=2021637 RepID=UPI00044A9A08|nr:hypothetical protein [Sphingobium sp. IP1]EZP70613.1 hypothetical protein BV96_03289 [Sphingomonas paucimobilis]PHP17261.1 hypothetical protein CG471_23785 [Sphingobium sp. IP1]
MIIAFTYLVSAALPMQAATPSRPGLNIEDGFSTSLSAPLQHIAAKGGDFAIRETSRTAGVQEPEQRLTFTLGAHVSLPLLNGSSASRKEAAHEAR